MMAEKPVREAPLIKRNALNPPMTGAMRKVAVVKKYPGRLVCARAGNSLSPELFAMEAAIRKPQTTIIQATIKRATSNCRPGLLRMLADAGFMLRPNDEEHR